MGQRRLQGIDGLFQRGKHRFVYRIVLTRSAVGKRRGYCKQAVLYAGKRIDKRGVRSIELQHSQPGRQLVNRAIGLDTCIVLGDALAPKQRGFAGIAFCGIYLRFFLPARLRFHTEGAKKARCTARIKKCGR